MDEDDTDDDTDDEHEDTDRDNDRCRRPEKSDFFDCFRFFRVRERPGEPRRCREMPGRGLELWGKLQGALGSSGDLKRALETPGEQRGTT